VSVIRFQVADFGKDIVVNDEDVQKHFDAHKAELKSEEKRKVEFITLALTDEQKQLTGKERIEVLQKLSDRATDFTQALLEKGADFKQAAAKFQLPVRETGEFTKVAPDPLLKDNPQLGTAAFKLSAQEPNSDPIQVKDGFYILHLTGTTEAKPLTIEEAKPKIVDAIKKSKSRELMSTKGAEIVQQLREAKQSGQPIEAVIQKSNAKVEKLTQFSLIEEEKPAMQEQEKKNQPPDLPSIKQAVAFLNAGEVSDFFPSGENGFVAILEKREPLAAANASEKKEAFEKRLLDNKRQVVLLEWLRDRYQAAGLKPIEG
jgi:PPIC-type PPIASE domain